jgi:hypothetical protein
MYSFSELMVYLSLIVNHSIHESDSHYLIIMLSADEHLRNALLQSVDTCMILVDIIEYVFYQENKIVL